jgi:hypothetical protein
MGYKLLELTSIYIKAVVIIIVNRYLLLHIRYTSKVLNRILLFQIR